MQSAAEERKAKARIECLRKEADALEAELAAIDTELFGSASSDYTRAAELDARKTNQRGFDLFADYFREILKDELDQF